MTPARQEAQSTVPALGVVWLIIGLALVSRDYAAPTGLVNVTCAPPLWTQATSIGLLLAASGIALWRRERWPSGRWWLAMGGLAAAFLVVNLLIAPSLPLECET